MNEPTPKQKVETLMKKFPNLSFQNACALLGYNPNDPELQPYSETEDILNTIFGNR